MYLTAFLEDTGIPVTKLARKAGIHEGTLYNVLKGRDVRLSIAIKIEKATKCRVSCNELYEEFFPEEYKNILLKH
jgi:predicted transcriptional regulator